MLREQRPGSSFDVPHVAGPPLTKLNLGEQMLRGPCLYKKQISVRTKMCIANCLH